MPENLPSRPVHGPDQGHLVRIRGFKPLQKPHGHGEKGGDHHQHDLGRHAEALNKLRGEGEKPLRERMGHTRTEIAAGIATGCAVAWALNALMG